MKEALLTDISNRTKGSKKLLFQQLPNLPRLLMPIVKKEAGQLANIFQESKPTLFPRVESHIDLLLFRLLNQHPKDTSTII